MSDGTLDMTQEKRGQTTIEWVSSMKQTKTYATLSILAMSVAIASCGGGGDAEAGSPTAFGVKPAEITITSGSPIPKGQCGSFYAGDVAVVGGAAPYRLINTSPENVLLHRSATDFTPVSSVGDRNGTFSVSIGGCVDPIVVVIADKLDNQVSLTLRNKPSAGATGAPPGL